MTTKTNSNLLHITALSATYNILLQISLRIVTFVSNAVILRYITRDVLGVLSVRLLLLYTTTQFLSREPFRRVCISANKSFSWSQLINLLSLCIPLSLIIGSLLSIIWCFALQTPDPNLVSDYNIGVISIFISVVIEIFAEPFFVYSQINSFIKLRVITDGVFLMCRCLIMICFVRIYPNKAIYVFSVSQIVSSLIYFLMYFVFFIYAQKLRVKHFIPQIKADESYLNSSLLLLTWGFLKNSTLKQILTEGEKFVMTLLNVISFSEQGVYDVINNIGSLPARLIFQPIEESGFLLFSQKINRLKAANEQNETDLEESSHILRNLLKLMILVGLVILTFGVNFSELALLMYGGNMLSDHFGIRLLQWHCVYILFIAINGVTECFTFATMSTKQIDQFNKRMLALSVFFLTSSYALTKLFGCQGFIMANCLNMASRILISVRFISNYYKIANIKSPLNDIIPNKFVFIVLLISYLILYFSRGWFCCETSIFRIFLFVTIGFFCLLLNLFVIYVIEKDVINFIMLLFKREKLKSL